MAFNVLLAIVVFCLSAAVWSIPILKKEDPPTRAIACVAVFLLLGSVAYSALWVQTSAQKIAELGELAKGKSWVALRERLSEIEDDQSLKDVRLYFLAQLYYQSFTTGATPDPEPLLARIEPDSPFYGRAQWLRYYVWARVGSERRAAALADSFERASLRGPMYYHLRLHDNSLTHSDVANLYDEFAHLHRYQFDFETMKDRWMVERGSPVQIDLRAKAAIKDCVLLFTERLLSTAVFARLDKEKAEALKLYDTLIEHNPKWPRILLADHKWIHNSVSTLRHMDMKDLPPSGLKVIIVPSDRDRDST